jgi:hypothetical protein
MMMSPVALSSELDSGNGGRRGGFSGRGNDDTADRSEQDAQRSAGDKGMIGEADHIDFLYDLHWYSIIYP